MNTLGANAPNKSHKIAGVLLFLAGTVVLMGIITAEIFYPSGYSTSQNEISDLGATRPPNSIIVEPAATIFNTTMQVSGLMLIIAAYFLYRAFQNRLVTGSMLAFGIGLLGVGIFPGNIASLHPLFAILTFIAAGIAPLASAKMTASPFRYFAILLGGTTLLFFCWLSFSLTLFFPFWVMAEPNDGLHTPVSFGSSHSGDMFWGGLSNHQTRSLRQGCA
jgi:hypothetical membrane protein